MMTVILEDNDHNEISRVSFPGNEQYLIRNEATFSLLSQLSEVSYDVFSPPDMGRLISELEKLSENVSEIEKSHIKDIINMACRCRDNATLTLTFTPFDGSKSGA